jgi:Icc-related predicted phosphoesterase
MKIVAISDTHMWGMPLKELPAGDVLVHAGDATYRGTEAEVQQFRNELVKHLEDSRYKKGYKHIIFVPGNHDWGFYNHEQQFRDMFQDYPNVHILINQEVVIDGVKFWGSPVCPPFGRWAFYLEDDQRRQLWNTIPDDTDILITHGPPKHVLDEVYNYWDNVEHTGCAHLANRVIAVKPKYHFFGHIHEGYGHLNVYGINFVNASIMNERYKPENKPTVWEV